LFFFDNISWFFLAIKNLASSGFDIKLKNLLFGISLLKGFKEFLGFLLASKTFLASKTETPLKEWYLSKLIINFSLPCNRIYFLLVFTSL
jgi:hypothetical protein